MIPLNKFSVCMSVYKNDNLLHFRQAIESIINQTIPPDEIVLVIDGPILEELSRYILDLKTQYNFITIIRLDKNQGLGNALRLGVENAKYDLIARMDSDDISVPDRFEKQLRCFNFDSNLSLVGGVIYEFIDSTLNVIGVRSCPLNDLEIKKQIKYRSPFNHVTVMFKKNDILKVGNYTDLYFNEDYLLWIKLCSANLKFLNLADNLVYVRVGQEMYSRRGGIKYFKSELKIQEILLKYKLINYSEFVLNVFIRLIIQVIIPNKLRAYIFRKFFRKQPK